MENDHRPFHTQPDARPQTASATHRDINLGFESPCRLIEFPKITDPRGNLTVAEAWKEVPFEIKRAYWTYDVPGGESRGGHAHKRLQQLLIAVSGSFSVTLDDGRRRQTFLLNHPWQGLLITPGVWRTLNDFSTGAVCLVLASDFFDEEDYIREYDEYLKYVACSR
ncbi:MAG: FdtA/QdtA family cupin domain-containing protein [Prevotella sp.]|nr:FdtA/QdtA family cupin domain-containing protein [Prevotella sp.]